MKRKKGDMSDKEVVDRIELIGDVIDGYRENQISPFATLIAIGVFANPQDVGVEELEWAVKSLDRHYNDDKIEDRCPECQGTITTHWSGVKCDRCGWWFCY